MNIESIIAELEDSLTRLRIKAVEARLVGKFPEATILDDIVDETDNAIIALAEVDASKNVLKIVAQQRADGTFGKALF